MKLLGKRLALRLMLAVVMGLTLAALGSSIVFAQETDDPVKIEIYKRFVDNRLPNPAVAYQAARDYLNKYNKDKDQYTDYLTKWTTAYERDERKRNLPIYINEKKFTEAYSTGAKILADEPNYLRAQIDLGYAGYIASSSKNEQFNTTALDYARTAIQAIESGKSPTVAYLHYAVGYLTLKTSPDQAIDSLIKAAQYESDIKKTPSTYYFLAVAYESGPYKTLSAAYQKDFADKPETPASKAALEKLGTVMDRIVDAYARAIAAAGTDAKTQQSRTEWTAQMTTYYKFRHNNTDTGLTDYISTALQRPLPPKP